MKFLLTVGIIAVIVFVLYSNFPQIKSKFYYSQCATPLTYTLGAVDSKFNISDADANADISSAVNIWNNTYGKPIFTNSSNGQIIVNFVYDQRSALNSQINDLSNQITNSKTTLSQQIKDYEAAVAAFNLKIENFNRKVQQLTKDHKIDRATYDQLIAEQNELASEAKALNVRAKDLNLETTNYNTTIQNLNQNVSEFNQAIAQKPEEGLYNGVDNTITIYFVSNHQELLHTLAHEFGHSLGMQHLEDPKSIMFPYSTPSTIVTAEDKQQLTDVCKPQPIYILGIKKLALLLYILKNNIYSIAKSSM